MSFDTIVFGSGLAGLSCARRLALSGRRVAVLERAPVIGGHLYPFQRRGVTFEVGIHYIAGCGPRSLFAQACSDLRIHPELVPLDEGFEEVRFEHLGETWVTRSPFHANITDLKLRFPQSAPQFDRFERDLDALWELANGLVFPLTTSALIRALLASRHMIRLARLVPLTLEGYLAGVLKLPKEACETVALQHLLIGVPPSRVSAVVALLVHRYYFEQPCFIRGGGRALIEMLRHPRVEYRTGVDARFRRRDRGGGFVVEWEGNRLEAQRVVWTPDPRLLASATDEVPGHLLRWRLRHVEEPHALVVGYFATKRDLREYGLANRNYWLMGELSGEQAYGEWPLLTLASKAPVYLSTGSLRDPLAVPLENALGARGLFQAMFLVAPGHPEWGGSVSSDYRRSEEKGGFRERYVQKKEEVLRRLSERVVASFPMLKGELVWQELGTPLTHARFLHSISQNGYGFSPTVFDLLVGRPSYETGVPDLYLCGAHIKPAHGIATALANGVGLGNLLG